jgi:putative membrane protein
MLIRICAAVAAICLSSSAAISEAAKLTDPQIAHIAYTAGEIDISAAKQALHRSSNKEVKQFARDMERDHATVNKQALDLVKKAEGDP